MIFIYRWAFFKDWVKFSGFGWVWNLHLHREIFQNMFSFGSMTILIWYLKYNLSILYQISNINNNDNTNSNDSLLCWATIMSASDFLPWFRIKCNFTDCAIAKNSNLILMSNISIVCIYFFFLQHLGKHFHQHFLKLLFIWFNNLENFYRY